MGACPNALHVLMALSPNRFRVRIEQQLGSRVQLRMQSYSAPELNLSHFIDPQGCSCPTECNLRREHVE